MGQVRFTLWWREGAGGVADRSLITDDVAVHLIVCLSYNIHTTGKYFAGLFTGHDPTRGSGQGGFKISRVGSRGFQNLAGRVGSDHNFLKFTGRVGSGRVKRFPNLAGRVGSTGFKTSRVGSGRVKRFQNLAGRVGSGQEVFKISRVGSGRDHEIRVTRESSHHDPRVVFG